jgi:hypothetical protein
MGCLEAEKDIFMLIGWGGSIMEFKISEELNIVSIGLGEI